MRDTVANWLVQKYQQSSYELAGASRSRSMAAPTTCAAWFKPSYGANGVYYRVVPAP